MLLADLGADVVKVENPDGGDTLRSWPPITDGYSENFASLNRNKRSVTLNLKDTAGAEVLQACTGCAGGDREQSPRRNGPSWHRVQGALAINPALVYCSISAYGQMRAAGHEGGFDLTVQAMSGIMSVTGEPGGPPVKCGVPLADFSAGLYAAFGIAAALRRRGPRARELTWTCRCWVQRSASRHCRRRSTSAAGTTPAAGFRAPSQRTISRFPQQGRLFRHGSRQ